MIREESEWKANLNMTANYSSSPKSQYIGTANQHNLQTSAQLTSHIEN